MTKKLGREAFIEKAREIHNNKYSYTKVSYTTCKNSVIITCPKHGDFEQTPDQHINKPAGCAKCAGRNKTLEEYISMAYKVHNGKYTYHNLSHTRSHDKGIITCPEHGDFKQELIGHLKGRGCSKCSGKNKTIDDFILHASIIHKNKYTYKNLSHTKSNEQGIITCQFHGDFSQFLRDHLQGIGCPKCSGRNRTVEEWIEKSILHHGDKYDYSNAVYIGSEQKIEIICPKHGAYWQLAYTHMTGIGCSKCSSNVSKAEHQWLDYLDIPKEYRHQRITVDGYKRDLVVDAFNPVTNTIYEFYGDLWHGNPEIYDQTEPHRVAKNKGTYGDVYRSTVERERRLKESGYNLITIWEKDWLLIRDMLS